MNTDKFGRIELTEQELVAALYKGQLDSLDSVYVQENIADKFNRSRNKNADQFNNIKSLEDLDITIPEFDKSKQGNWFMPDEYKVMDIEGFLVNVCPKQNYQRIIEELRLFKQHNMLDLLRYLKYLVDTMKANNIVWGVGRGSSVASYVLYLLGVHKIDSVKYKLDIHEFLKEKDHGI